MTARRAPSLILAAGWLGFLLYAYPGYLTSSAIDQLVDSRVGEFTDWSSPLMTELWRLVGWFIAGPAGMLLLGSGLFLGGTYALLRRAMTERRAAIAASCVLLFPPVATTLAVIWPESLMASLLVAGAAALLGTRRRLRLGGLALLLLAAGMRDGAAIAVLPILALGFVLRADLEGWRRYAIAVATWAALASAAWGLRLGLADTVTHRPQVTRAAVDITGILRFAPTITDSSVKRALAGASLSQARDLQRRATISYGHEDRLYNPELGIFFTPGTDDQRDAMLRGRATLMRSFPKAYVAHRWYEFVHVLGLASHTDARPVVTTFLETQPQLNATQHLARHSDVQQVLVDAATWLGDTWLFAPYVYFFVGVILLPVAASRRQRDTVILLASGLAFELSALYYATDDDFRQSQWMVACVLIATIMLIARGWSRSGRSTAVVAS